MHLTGNLRKVEASNICPFFICLISLNMLSRFICVVAPMIIFVCRAKVPEYTPTPFCSVCPLICPWVASTFGPLWTTCLWTHRYLKSCFQFYQVHNQKWGCYILRDRMVILLLRFLRINPGVFCLFLYLFSPVLRQAKTGFKLVIALRMTWTNPPARLLLQHAGVTGVCHWAWVTHCWALNPVHPSCQDALSTELPPQARICLAIFYCTVAISFYFSMNIYIKWRQKEKNPVGEWSMCRRNPNSTLTLSRKMALFP